MVIASPARRIVASRGSISCGFSRSMECPWATLKPRFIIRFWLSGPMPRSSPFLREHLRETDDFRIETAASGFEAGIRAESFHPDCIIIDMALGRIEAGQIAQNLRRSPDHQGTILLALTSDEPGEETFALGFNDGFKKPFDGALLGRARPPFDFAEKVRRTLSEARNAPNPSSPRKPIPKQTNEPEQTILSSGEDRRGDWSAGSLSFR